MRSTIGSNYGDRTNLVSASSCNISVGASGGQDVVQISQQSSNSCVSLQGYLIARDRGYYGSSALNLEVVNGVQLVSYVVNNQIQSVVGVLYDPSVGYIVIVSSGLGSLYILQRTALSAALVIDVDNSGILVDLVGLGVSRSSLLASLYNVSQQIAAGLLGAQDSNFLTDSRANNLEVRSRVLSAFFTIQALDT